MTAKFYVGLLPWVVFAVVARSGGQGVAWAGLAAALCAVAVLTDSVRTQSPTSLNWAGVVLFAALAAAGVGFPDQSGLVGRYGRSLSAAGLALVAFGSLRFRPLLGPYTGGDSGRSDADRRKGNIVLTVLWGATAAAVAVSHAVAAGLGTPQSATIFNWIVPIGLIVTAVHQTAARASRYFDEDFVSIEALAGLFDVPGELTSESRTRS